MPSRRVFMVAFGVSFTGVSGCTSMGNQADAGTNSPDDGESTVLLAGANENKEIPLIYHSHVKTVGEVQEINGQYSVEMELTKEGEDSFYDGLEELGATERPEEIELYTYHNGEIVHTSGITADLAERPEEEADSSVFHLPVPNQETGNELKSQLEDS